MTVSIEVPVFKGAFLRQCIDSVLAQTSNAWTLSLVWDGGDRESREMLEALDRQGHARIRVHFTENRGIAPARRFLTEHSEGPYVLPLDDDDMLAPQAVERFLDCAAERPWASLIRARRSFIDADGGPAYDGPPFPFAPRSYFRGMATDLFNQAQPYLIRRTAYERTQGWRGYAEFKGAGEDCDLFLQLEEVAPFELLDEDLYRYRVHGSRTSVYITPAAAFEMWRRLADETLARIGLPLRRASAEPPFLYEPVPAPPASPDDVDYVVPRLDGGAATALRRCGVPAAAICGGDRRDGSGAWRMEGFAAAGRRLVCFVDDRVEIADGSALETLVRALNRSQADLLAPRLVVDAGAVAAAAPARSSADFGLTPFPPPGFGRILLVRREVLKATGGFDPRWVAPALQGVDLWIQARRRGFRCVQSTVPGLAPAGTAGPDWSAENLAALRSKWRSYAALLGGRSIAAASEQAQATGQAGI